MLRVEIVMTIEILYRQGMSKRGIAARLGLSINTVKKYLKSGGTYKIKKSIEKGKKLLPYADYLKERIESVWPDQLPATVLCREIVAKGYEGKIRQLRYYLSEYYGTKKEDPVIRFETAPGKQMQVDWIEFRRGKNRLSAFVATLGYSRCSYVEFVTDEKLETLIRCHENAFNYFGGVVCEVLYDNMKTVVIERDAYGEGKHRFQKGFWDFAKHYGFVPKLCRPYRAKTKGKVERFNRYLRYSFYLPLASRLKAVGSLLDKDKANVEVRYWLDVEANQRIHGTTGKIPWEELLIEQRVLMPIALPYSGKIPKEKEVELFLTKNKKVLEAYKASSLIQQRPLSVYENLLH